jgi:hypothetical protein
MKQLFSQILLLTLGLGAFGCRNAPEARELTSLRRSGDATFVCVGPGGKGAPLSFCPQGGRADDLGLTVGNEGHSLYSLVTQTLSAEIAVVRVAGADTGGDSRGKVLDVDPTNPGVTPLRIGEQPTDIVTTPGGLASFVGVAQVGLPGIYAIPTECITAPDPDEPRRDRTTWPACSLSSAPGDMVVLVDEAEESGTPRAHCGEPPDPTLPRATAETRCTADLSLETATPGARKLLVSLPREGKLVVLDAQDIVSRQPGTYQPCHIEAEVPLSAEVPDDILQPLPEDLVLPGESTWITYQEVGGSYEPLPAGMAQDGDVVLVADQGAPVIHQIDTTDACAPTELAPLYATSFEDPTRVVTTSEIAVSPITPSGAQYAYVVDEVGDGRSNVMVFDLSSSAQSRAPLLRQGSSLVPFEAPDRLEFATGVKDVGFALLDRAAVDPATGVATTGVYCDPDPSTSPSAPGALYRPSGPDGPFPGTLRGLFGYVLLSNGGVSVVDIEDFDFACRRPLFANASSVMDHRGCLGDEIDADYFTQSGRASGTPTVTEEASCRMVVPHRVRSRILMETSESAGVNSPGLRTFGRLSLHGRGLNSSRLTPEGKHNPILLGVDFEGPDGRAIPAHVYVGDTLHTRGDPSSDLVTDPNWAERVSAVLPIYDPRAHPPTESVSVVYEGRMGGTHDSGTLGDSELGSDHVRLTDPNLLFCSLGMQDQTLTRQVGEERFGLSGSASDRFVEQHTDYVQIANQLYAEKDDYWDQAGRLCGFDIPSVSAQGYRLCDALFGQGDEEELLVSRDLTIARADAAGLDLTPRSPGVLSASEHLELLQCCFPGAVTFRARAGRQWVVQGSGSGFQHRVTTDPTGESNRCVFDNSPLASRLEGRAFEVTSVLCDNDDPTDIGTCGVGLRTRDDVVCTYDATQGPVEVGGIADDCIFNGLTRRFVVYRGLLPSRRDMSFLYDVIGGFQTFNVSLTRSSSVVLPVSLVEVPTFGAFGIVDSQNRGLMMFDTANSQVAQSFF